ncbi:MULTISPECIES: TetR/AcrR family transcriptional regulator [Streptosporangium]|uniref:AcrR family transcriptional regulator n=1 Tax=Streptosporangium brasiliense TaxID=47480 RepID=A0ABT9R4V2_9ACTN|nr:TetR/AcrR family transcriptional regulator [Streptosporangium brasiliense]MDP9863839.1 AcrR family transcriptional regulator [Streptosporangium brasiliense]
MITVSDITKLADVHRSTFYRHYRDKFHMIETLHADGTRKGLSSLLVATGHPVAPYRYVAALVEILEHFAAYKRLYHALLVHRRSTWFEQWLHARWTESIHQLYNGPSPSAPPGTSGALVELRTRITVETSLATLKWWVQGDCSLTAEQLACWYARHMLNGFARTTMSCPSGAH